jgi:hypothetical protein
MTTGNLSEAGHRAEAQPHAILSPPGPATAGIHPGVLNTVRRRCSPLAPLTFIVDLAELRIHHVVGGATRLPASAPS